MEVYVMVRHRHIVLFAFIILIAGCTTTRRRCDSDREARYNRNGLHDGGEQERGEEKGAKIVDDDDLHHSNRERPPHHWQAPEVSTIECALHTFAVSAAVDNCSQSPTCGRHHQQPDPHGEHVLECTLIAHQL
jgi:hypothetical protein